MKISAAIITLNEEINIEACLASLDFVDEIIVVDSGSSDRTEEICRKFPKVSFYHQPWLGFGPQKNHAVSLASNDWIISVDADELVTSELGEEIKSGILSSSDCAGFIVRRRNIYRGQWIRHGGWWPDEVLRIFRKSRASFNSRKVHESVDIQGPVNRLQGLLEHHPYKGAEDFIIKMKSYSLAGACQMKEEGRRGGPITSVIRAGAAFIKSYMLKMGFLDGRAGLLIAVTGALGVFYRLIKLSELYDEN